MPPRIGLIPVVRIHASRRTVDAALELMLEEKGLGISEESIGVQGDSNDYTVVINGENEKRSAIAGAAGYLKGWCDGRGFAAELL